MKIKTIKSLIIQSLVFIMLTGILLYLSACAIFELSQTDCPPGTFASGAHCFGQITITPNK